MAVGGFLQTEEMKFAGIAEFGMYDKIVNWVDGAIFEDSENADN